MTSQYDASFAYTGPISAEVQAANAREIERSMFMPSKLANAKLHANNELQRWVLACNRLVWAICRPIRASLTTARSRRSWSSFRWKIVSDYWKNSGSQPRRVIWSRCFRRQRWRHMRGLKRSRQRKLGQMSKRRCGWRRTRRSWHRLRPNECCVRSSRCSTRRRKRHGFVLGARGDRTQHSSVGFRCGNMVIDRGPTNPDSHRVQGTPQFTTSPDPGIVGMSLFVPIPDTDFSVVSRKQRFGFRWERFEHPRFARSSRSGPELELKS